jgi:hypothetical protein
MQIAIRLDINGHAHEVHRQEMTGAEIKALENFEDGNLFRVDGEQQLRVDDAEKLNVRDGARFVFVPDKVGHRVEINIEVDGKAYVAERRRMTGTQIKALARRPPGNALYRLRGNQRFVVGASDEVELHERERFVTVPPHGHAS